MQINAFKLLIPLEVALVKIQLFLFFSSGMYWEEEEEERGQTYLRKKKKPFKSHGLFSQTYLLCYSVPKD